MTTLLVLAALVVFFFMGLIVASILQGDRTIEILERVKRLEAQSTQAVVRAQRNESNIRSVLHHTFVEPLPVADEIFDVWPTEEFTVKTPIAEDEIPTEEILMPTVETERPKGNTLVLPGPKKHWSQT